jgi:hypothetical protein
VADGRKIVGLAAHPGIAHGAELAAEVCAFARSWDAPGVVPIFGFVVQSVPVVRMPRVIEDVVVGAASKLHAEGVQRAVAALRANIGHLAPVHDHLDAPVEHRADQVRGAARLGDFDVVEARAAQGVEGAERIVDRAVVARDLDLAVDLHVCRGLIPDRGFAIAAFVAEKGRARERDAVLVAAQHRDHV